MDSLVKIIAKDFIVIPVIVAAYFWYWRLPRADRRRSLIFLIALAVLSLLFAFIGQHAYVNPRPPFKDGAVPLFKPSDYNGFPSDHTLLASVIGFWIYKYNRRLGVGLLVLAIIIGWSRVAAHVHHAVDIAGAFLMVGVAYLITLGVYRYYSPRRAGHHK